jgi:hypothetical protein
MHRPARNVGGASRAVPHPGVGGGANSEPTFVSPFQPPPAHDDLAADTEPHGWKSVHVGDFHFRVRSPQPEAIHVLSMAWSQHQKSERISTGTLMDLVARYTHPDDLAVALMAMADPDDGRFGTEEFHDLVKGIVTVGTARPFWPSLVW